MKKQKPHEKDDGKIATEDSKKDQKEELDRKLDEQLEESFPASDPPGYVEAEDDDESAD